VYADDDGLNASAAALERPGLADFHIVADADPNVLLRIGAILNLLNIAPRAFHMETNAEGLVAVHALVDQCGEHQADLVARKLGQLTCIRTVILQHRRPPELSSRGS
jgi:hypothetical protein